MRKKLLTGALALGMVAFVAPQSASAQVTDSASAEIRVTIDTAVELRIRTVEQNGVALVGDDFDAITYSANQDETPATNDPSVYTDEEVVDHGGDAARMLITPRNFSTMTDEVRILTNSTSGFRLDAQDGSDTTALTRVGGGATITDWTGTLTAPSAMANATADYGFGLTVVSIDTDTADAKWANGDSYAGLPAAYSAAVGDELYTRADYNTAGNGQTIVTTRYQMNVDITQMEGDYDGTIDYQVTTL